MKIARLLPAVAGLLLLSACGYNSLEIQGIRAASPSGGTAFTQALVTEYKAQVEEEITVQYEWYHASIFARKGLKAAAGETVLPFGQETFPSPAAQAAGMEAERARLIRALDGNGRLTKPTVAARAQAMYDCWLEEVWEAQDDGVCKAAYMKAMADLETKPVLAKQPSPARNFLVFFDFNKADITAEAAKIIAQAADEAKKGNKSRIDLIGHADRSGSDKYNLALSMRRGEAVKAALAKHGIAAGNITVTGKGESTPLVPTPDGAREPQNRRVEIVLP